MSSTFSPTWLDLREPLDASSRAVHLVGMLSQARSMQEVQTRVDVLDLGSGTGANLRYLAPLLGRQSWRLIDRDDALLRGARRRLMEWAAVRNADVIQENGVISIRGDRFSCDVSFEPLDL